MVPDIVKAVSRIEEELSRICMQYNNDKQHAKAWESALKALEGEPLLMWKERISPDRMGVHQANRGGMGIVKSKCMSLGAANCDAGYSFLQASKEATASSCPPPNEEWQVFNEGLNARQQIPALLAPKGLSLGSGHGNGFLRLVLAKAPCAIKSLAPNGFLDPIELSSKHPGLREALEGLEWRVIHYLVFQDFPLLAKIAQQTLNAKNMQVTTEVEGLLTMSQLAAASQHPEWDRIAEDACHAKPFWEPWSKSIAAFAARTPQELIQEFANHTATLVT